MAKRDYLVEAAKQIRMALDREVNEDYEAAFSYYKNGVDLLLNGVQVDPNKERREAVKRKTRQYLQRAEDIFILHLQDNLGKGSETLGGYSSLRFRPIRHLSSPVEDLEMCKVVGIIDKVLTVQSLINKETFVVKSLPKSSWESRDQPTIIPQGVPFMVKLLRYYVSEDAVYLHLEHVQGGRLFSRLHQKRSERAKEHPECNSPQRHRVRLKTSHTSPAISTDYQRHTGGAPGPRTMVTLLEGERDPNSPVSPAAPWDEAQQRLDSCGTHSYCEETGCLQNLRSVAPPPSASPLSPSSPTPPGTARTNIGSHIPPIPCQHSETQGNPDLPIQPFIGQALDVASGLPGFRPIETSSDFDVMWNAAKPERSCSAPYAEIGSPDTHAAKGAPVPQNTPRTSEATESSSAGTEPPAAPGQRRGSSSPATLHLPLQSQSQVTLSAHGWHHHRGPAGEPGDATDGVTTRQWTDSGAVETAHQGRDSGAVVTALLARDSGAVVTALQGRDSGTVVTALQGRDSHTAEEELLGSAQTTLDHRAETSSSGGAQRPVPRKVSLALTGVQYQARPGEEVEEAWELLSPGGLGPSPNCFPLTLSAPYPPVPPGASPQCRRGDMDAFLKAEASEVEVEGMMEVEGWCHLPRTAQRSSAGRARQGSWGLPEAEVRLLGAQILLALESLHQQGVLCRDLNPNNILLGSNGKVCLTFFSQWSEVQSEISPQAMEQMYCAPEIGGVSKITEACDWWSLGALLFELLTETPLWQFHPAGVRSHTQLLIPDHLSTAAASLLTELLQFDAGYRLGSGGGGVSDIKCHPFFNGVPWQTLGS